MLMFLIGALTMLVGVVFGWSLSETQHKNQKINLNVYDKRGENQ